MFLPGVETMSWAAVAIKVLFVVGMMLGIGILLYILCGVAIPLMALLIVALLEEKCTGTFNTLLFYFCVVVP